MPETNNSPNLNQEPEKTARPIAPAEPTSFPTGMFFLALLFDLIGIIPLINIPSELLAGLIFGMWQKSYSPKTDPVTTFIVAKIIDIISLGFLPSNIGIVVYAYIKKKAAAAVQTPLGQYAANKMLKNQQA